MLASTTKTHENVCIWCKAWAPSNYICEIRSAGDV